MARETSACSRHPSQGEAKLIVRAASRYRVFKLFFFLSLLESRSRSEWNLGGSVLTRTPATPAKFKARVFFTSSFFYTPRKGETYPVCYAHCLSRWVGTIKKIDSCQRPASRLKPDVRNLSLTILVFFQFVSYIKEETIVRERRLRKK